MIKGMTGYGSTEVAWTQIKGTLEVKSQNHRYFDLVFYLPPGFSALEDRIRQILTREMKRGRVTLSFKMSSTPTAKYLLNKQTVKTYFQQAKALKRQFAIDDKITFGDLVGLPGVIEVKETPVDLNRFWPALEKGLKRAMAGCVHMRRREGNSLAADFRKILKQMTGLVKKIQKQAQRIASRQKKILNPDEFISFQKSNNISEELARLHHYIQEFTRLLSSREIAGKKMDFIAQEMQRETNTIGSKLQDTLVSTAVISLKSHIEKLREQAQNIE